MPDAAPGRAAYTLGLPSLGHKARQAPAIMRANGGQCGQAPALAPSPGPPQGPEAPGSRGPEGPCGRSGLQSQPWGLLAVLLCTLFLCASVSMK